MCIRDRLQAVLNVLSVLQAVLNVLSVLQAVLNMLSVLQAVLNVLLCKKADHTPDKCEEADDQKNARTHLENEMSEALVRECPKCHKRFVKESGCNKMTCSCGNKMCYICRQSIVDYNHFHNGTCELHTNDLEALHRSEVMRRAAEVKENIDTNLLLHDPSMS
ncbi:probable E3 ubiquitin-protein ligase ARI10 [Hyalella azteca]|uniref:Probable E3 ubiquitin-protein ligase ARI10 n=1 Tax=Hyalella azteca TaxID=294128 RepID=A0A8B7NI79_HYAAZ|nr:probable E3 ubiquitin-protein ligase ARI10 [Hyalella azteca]